jgi:hypothetical protein
MAIKMDGNQTKTVLPETMMSIHPKQKNKKKKRNTKVAGCECRDQGVREAPVSTLGPRTRDSNLSRPGGADEPARGYIRFPETHP